MKINSLAITIAFIFVTPTSYAANSQPQHAVDSCLKSTLDAHPGKATSIRSELEDGKPQYEIDISGKDGKQWETECDASTGKIIESEGEVAADHRDFISKAKISLDAALKTVLKKYPGAVLKTEYEIEADGVAYEFDIKTASGKVLEVEVNAITGELGSPEELLFQIGE